MMSRLLGGLYGVADKENGRKQLGGTSRLLFKCHNIRHVITRHSGSMFRFLLFLGATLVVVTSKHKMAAGEEGITKRVSTYSD